MNNTLPIRNIVLKHGILLGVLTIALFGIVYFTDHYVDPPWWNTLGRIITVVLITYLGLKSFKSANNDSISLKQCLKIGFFIAIVAGLTYASFNLIFTTVLEPEYVIEIQEAAAAEVLRENPNMPADQLEAANTLSGYILQPGVMALFSVIGAIFYGLIASLIIGLVMRTKKA